MTNNPVTPVPLSLEEIKLIRQFMDVSKTPESIEMAKKLAYYEYLMQNVASMDLDEQFLDRV